MYTCDHSFLNFLRCISEPRQNIEKLRCYFFRETRNGKLNICNGKLIIMYLSISKRTYWDAYSNQDEWNKREKWIFKKKLDVVVMEESL